MFYKIQIPVNQVFIFIHFSCKIIGIYINYLAVVKLQLIYFFSVNKSKNLLQIYNE